MLQKFEQEKPKISFCGGWGVWLNRSSWVMIYLTQVWRTTDLKVKLLTSTNYQSERIHRVHCRFKQNFLLELQSQKQRRNRVAAGAFLYNRRPLWARETGSVRDQVLERRADLTWTQLSVVTPFTSNPPVKWRLPITGPSSSSSKRAIREAFIDGFGS